MNAEHEKQVALMKFLSGIARKLGVAEEVYIVGGAVRDFVLGHPIKDLDVVIDPTKTGKDSAWFAEQLDRHIPVDTSYITNNYGVAIITVKGEWILDGHDLSGEVIEIANTRKESYGGEGGKGYKPSEVTSADIVEDTIRREFNFNTLLWRLSDVAKGPDKDAILDLTGCGLSDLAEGVLRCPSDPNKTFSDDPTRMIRVIKFLLRYKMKPTPDTVAAIKANAKKLRNIPYEAVAKLLVADCFKEPTYAKALSYMADYGLLDVIKEMMEDNRDFRTYMQRWALTKPVAMMLDLMDIGLPLQTNVNFLTVDQIASLREITLQMSKEDSLDFLSALKQPASVWKDKTFFDTLCVEYEISPKEIGNFAKRVNTLTRDILLENPTLITNPDTIRKSVMARLKDPSLRLAGVTWDPTKVSRIQVALDDPEAPISWFRKQVTKTLPHTNVYHICLWENPPVNIAEGAPYGTPYTVKVVGYVNEPNVQALAVSVRPNQPVEAGRFLFLPLATDGTSEMKAGELGSRVIPVSDGPTYTGKLSFRIGDSSFVQRGKAAGKMLPLMEPLHNLREIIKQMILLEDHLFQPPKQCGDCIDKHLLAIEAFAEEMVTLSDPNSPYQKYGTGIADFARLVSYFLDTSGKEAGKPFAASALRKVRKKLTDHLRDAKKSAPKHPLKKATKTTVEKEDESARDLVKPSPKLKPPRKDSRKERVDSVDPDIASFKKEKYRGTSKNHKFT